MIDLIHIGKQKDTPPLVAIPGIDGSIGSVKPLMEGISDHREVIVVDYSAEKNPSLEDLSEEVYQKIKVNVEGPCYLSGQSIGTILAAKLVDRDLPVQKVVLTSTFTKLSPLPLKISTFFMHLSPEWLYRLTTRPVMSYVCGPVGDGRDHPFFEASKKTDKVDIRRRTKWQIDTDFSPDLQKIKQPLLILMGEDDRFVPNASKEFKKLQNLFEGKKDFCVQSIAHAGHVFLPSQAIETAITKINQFLK